MKRLLLMTLLVCTIAIGLGIQRARADCIATNGNANDDFGCMMLGSCGLFSTCVLWECGVPTGYVCFTAPKGVVQCTLTGCAFLSCPNNCVPA
jgi:hypothetical protein